MWRLRSAAVLISSLCTISLAVAQERPEDWIPSLLQAEELSGTLPGAADEGITPRPIVQIALGLIKTFEGWWPDVYDDPVGYCTIGYGHLIAKKKCDQITDYNLGEFSPILTEQAGNQLLANDTRPARRAIQRLVTEQLTNRQFGALTAFVFNVGASNFARSTMLKRLNDADYEGAAKEFPKWTRAKNVVLRGLVRRRNCEMNLFMEQGELLANGLFDDSQCTALSGAAPSFEESIDIEQGEDS